MIGIILGIIGLIIEMETVATKGGYPQLNARQDGIRKVGLLIAFREKDIIRVSPGSGYIWYNSQWTEPKVTPVHLARETEKRHHYQTNRSKSQTSIPPIVPRYPVPNQPL